MCPLLGGGGKGRQIFLLKECFCRYIKLINGRHTISLEGHYLVYFCMSLGLPLHVAYNVLRADCSYELNTMVHDVDVIRHTKDE